MFPLLLDLRNRLVLVVGGGAVGRRKAQALLDAGARVRLVCLEPRPAEENAPQLEWRSEAFTGAHLDGVCLVVAAGPADVNRGVVLEAQKRGLWVCDASEPQRGNWLMPAVVRRGDLVLAISTGVPALTRALRQRLEAEFDPAFADWVALLAEARTLLRERITDEKRRRELLEGFCDFAWLERLRVEGREAVQRALRVVIEEASSTIPFDVAGDKMPGGVDRLWSYRMRSLAEGLPPEIASRIHPDWRKNEAEYWAVRDRLLPLYRGQWVAFADGVVVASGTSPVEVLHAAQQSGRHPFVICVGKEDEPTRMRRASFPYDTAYPGEALPLVSVEFRQASGVPGQILPRVIPDTGADASALPWVDCQQLQLDLTLAVPGLMGGVGGSTAATVTFPIWVWLDGQEYPCRLQVDFLGQERILGRDVLNRLEVLFRGPSGEVIVNP
jgi:precorrin-2 dehydrogenase/sirohydrochlorin ferrochelatase